MRIFGSDRLDSMLGRLGMKEGEAIVHPWVNKALEKAQGKVEARNFDIRKNLLKFDDVMNDQRKAVFAQRREIMEAADVAEVARDMRHQVVDDLVDEHVPPKAYADQWDIDGLAREVKAIFGIEPPLQAWADEEGVDDEAIRERLLAATDELMAGKVARYGAETMREVEKQVLLQTIDAELARAPRHPRPPAQRRRLPRLRPARPAERVQVRGLHPLRDAAEPAAHRGHAACSRTCRS